MQQKKITIRSFPQTLSSSHTRSILSTNNFHSFCNLQIRRHFCQRVQTGGTRRGGGDITALRRSRIRAYFFDPKTLRFISATELQLSRRRYQDVKLNRFKRSLAGFFVLCVISQFWLWRLWSSHVKWKHVSRGPLLEMQSALRRLLRSKSLIGIHRQLVHYNDTQTQSGYTVCGQWALF